MAAEPEPEPEPWQRASHRRVAPALTPKAETAEPSSNTPEGRDDHRRSQAGDHTGRRGDQARAVAGDVQAGAGPRRSVGRAGPHGSWSTCMARRAAPKRHSSPMRCALCNGHRWRSGARAVGRTRPGPWSAGRHRTAQQEVEDQDGKRYSMPAFHGQGDHGTRDGMSTVAKTDAIAALRACGGDVSSEGLHRAGLPCRQTTTLGKALDDLGCTIKSGTATCGSSWSALMRPSRPTTRSRAT